MVIANILSGQSVLVDSNLHPQNGQASDLSPGDLGHGNAPLTGADLLVLSFVLICSVAFTD